MDDSPILFDVAGPVATVTINRPARMNAMDSHAHLAFSEALDAIASDSAIRVVVITGAGRRAFCAGRDLKELSTVGSDAEQAAIEDRWRNVTRLTDRHDFPKPVIAKVRGLALGGGFELALACDIIVASDDASFALPEPKRGLIPSAGGVHRLPRQIPLKIAMGHLLTGRSMTAARAYALGLVNDVVPADDLDAAVARWADDIIACAPLSIASILQSVSCGLDRALPDAMTTIFPAETARQRSSDALEGPRAFAEKRLPVWTGT